MLRKQLLSLMFILNIAYSDINKSSKDIDIIDINSTTINKTNQNIEHNQSTITTKEIHIKPKNNPVETDNKLNIIKVDKNKAESLDTTKFLKVPIESYKSTYLVKQGDTIGAIARRFNVAQSEILIMNPQIIKTNLKIGKEIFMPLDQAVVDEIVKREKTDIKNLKSTTVKSVNQNDTLIIKGTGKELRVTASAYTSHVEQTSSTPFIGAWGYRLTPGERTIAISRDLEIEYGLTNGKKVKIGGLDGEYIVRDKMNKRYTKHIDIYMGLDKAKALRWGRRSVMIYW